MPGLGSSLYDLQLALFTIMWAGTISISWWVLFIPLLILTSGVMYGIVMESKIRKMGEFEENHNDDRVVHGDASTE